VLPSPPGDAGEDASHGDKLANLKVGQLLYGIATFIPGVAAVFGRGGGDTNSARYCYSVWLRHLVSAFANGMKDHPRTVAELGPGDSLGVGLAALVSGADRYHAFDVVRHAQVERNQAVLDELVELFRARADIPGEAEFPEVQPLLPSYAFPRHVLGDEELSAALSDERLARIRDSVRNQNTHGSMIDYARAGSTRAPSNANRSISSTRRRSSSTSTTSRAATGRCGSGSNRTA